MQLDYIKTAQNYLFEKKFKESNVFEEYILFFSNFDAVNEFKNVFSCSKTIECDVDDNNLILMNCYITNVCSFEKLKNVNFKIDLENGRVFVESDAVFHAVISVLLVWSAKSLLRLKEMFKHLESFIDLFEEYGNNVYVYEDKYFLRNGLDIFKKWYESPNDIVDVFYEINVNLDFIYGFANLLFTNKLTQDDAEYLENFNEPLLNYNVKKSNVKYFTGTACSGKSTFSIPLTKNGWIVKSRGDLGSFSAKAHCAATICSLYQAEYYALSGKKVIGDRGLIDNLIWFFMMYVMDQSKEDVVDEFIRFLESVLNECSIKQFMSENVIIFLDLKPEENRKRMSRRAQGGDIQRCRIFRYPYVQTLCYGMIALLFGWKIFTVPYDENDKVNFKKYDKVVSYIEENFPKDGFCFEDKTFLKPKNNFLIEHNYAKSVGIYK